MREKIANFKNTLKIYHKRNNLIVSIIFFLAVLFPLYISIREIANDGIPFWYDPARDMLLALDNLAKPTLIGPPSGIPGIFYGPHWLWLLSFGLTFSKDPRVVTILILTIPYFTVFPFLLFKFARIFGKKIVLILWFLFIFGFKSYSTYLWSPHLASFFFLAVIYLFIFTDLNGKRMRDNLKILLAGIFCGLILNLHISFGVAIILSSLVFLAAEFFFTNNKKNWRDHGKNRIIVCLSFILGLFLSLTPNLIFEMRHGFHQIQAVIFTLSQSLIYHSAVVGYAGLNKKEIISEFTGILANLLNVKTPLVIPAIYSIITIYLISNWKKYSLKTGYLTKKLFLYLVICTFLLLGIFLNSKNPIWAYHFIGSELLTLFFIGIILTKFPLFKNLLMIWVVVLIIINIHQITKLTDTSPLTVSSLATKKYISSLIYQDAKKGPFSVFAYSTAIYTFDYDYIFRWFGTDIYLYEPDKNESNVKYIYLIIPNIAEANKADFINYRTPNDKYRTAYEWEIPDGTNVVKREKLISLP